MPKLLLVRHGQASFGAEDYDRLSELGERQAALAAAELSRRADDVGRLASGSLLRQRQTSDPFAALTGLPVEIDPRWNEYDSADLLTAHSPSEQRLEGMAGVTSATFQVILEDGLRAWADAGTSSGAAESWPAFRARVDAALADALAALPSGQTGVVFTSGGVIAAACTTLLGGDLSTFIGLNRTVVNAAVTTLLAGRRGHSLLAFNEHAHLLGAGEPLVTFR